MVEIASNVEAAYRDIKLRKLKTEESSPAVIQCSQIQVWDLGMTGAGIEA